MKNTDHELNQLAGQTTRDLVDLETRWFKQSKIEDIDDRFARLVQLLNDAHEAFRRASHIDRLGAANQISEFIKKTEKEIGAVGKAITEAEAQRRRSEFILVYGGKRDKS